jgi:hypothetical protein
VEVTYKPLEDHHPDFGGPSAGVASYPAELAGPARAAAAAGAAALPVGPCPAAAAPCPAAATRLQSGRLAEVVRLPSPAAAASGVAPWDLAPDGSAQL